VVWSTGPCTCRGTCVTGGRRSNNAVAGEGGEDEVARVAGEPCGQAITRLVAKVPHDVRALVRRGGGRATSRDRYPGENLGG
jgi:hypothetical protein